MGIYTNEQGEQIDDPNFLGYDSNGRAIWGGRTYSMDQATDTSHLGSISSVIQNGDDRQFIIGPDGQQWQLAAQTVNGGVVPDSGDEVRRKVAELGLDPNTHTYGYNGLPYVSTAAAQKLGQKYGGFDGSALGVALAMGGLAAVVGPAIAAGAGAASGGGAAGASAGLSAADVAGLTQMGIDAGLSGSGLEAFISSGGTLGSTAAGGGGVSGLLEGAGGGESGGGIELGEGAGGGDFTMEDLLNMPTGGGQTTGGSSAYDPYALTGPSTTGTGAGLTTQPAAGAGSLGAITGGVSGLGSLAGAAGGGGSPVQPGYNPLDPSTYGGSGGSGGAGGAGGASNALSRILDGTATAADWTSFLGGLGATGLGIAGANAQQDAFKDVYDKQMALGAPSRARYEASFNPGWSLTGADPSVQSGLDTASETVLRKLSATGGNPYGNPGAITEAQNYLMGNYIIPQTNTYRSQNLTGGQLGTNTAGTASLQGAGNSGGMYDAIGGGLGMLTQPDNNLSSLMSKYKLNLGGIA